MLGQDLDSGINIICPYFMLASFFALYILISTYIEKKEKLKTVKNL